MDLVGCTAVPWKSPLSSTSYLFPCRDMWKLDHWLCSKLTLVFLAHTNHLTSFSSLVGETEPGCKSHRGGEVAPQTPSQQLTLQPVTATGLWTSQTSTKPGPTVPPPCHSTGTTLRTNLHPPETPQISVCKEGTRSCNLLLVPSHGNRRQHEAENTIW